MSEPVNPQPPIVFIDENGDVGPMFASVDELIEYLEWPEQADGETADAFDSRGRHILLRAEPDHGPVNVTLAEDEQPEILASRLRALIHDRPFSVGLLDADVSLDVLLRAVWPRLRYGKAEYPLT